MRTYIKKILISSLLVAALSVGIGYYIFVPLGPIYEFNATRDTQDILSLFQSDRYWLLSSPDYSPEFALKYRTPNKDPRYLGKLHIKVLREHNDFIGFVAYYMKTTTDGLLLFIAIKPALRGKHYGEILMHYAINDFKRLGAKTIHLVTRTTNIQAQKLYKRIGFVETSRDEEGYVYFEYKV